MPLTATKELSLFSYEILGLVGRDGAAPHDLLRLAKRGRMLAWAGESRYYSEPKRYGFRARRAKPCIPNADYFNTGSKYHDFSLERRALAAMEGAGLISRAV